METALLRNPRPLPAPLCSSFGGRFLGKLINKISFNEALLTILYKFLKIIYYIFYETNQPKILFFLVQRLYCQAVICYLVYSY